MISLTKVEVKVVNTKPLERDVGGVEDDGGGDVVVEREGEEVLKPVEKRVLVGEKVNDEGVGVGV